MTGSAQSVFAEGDTLVRTAPTRSRVLLGVALFVAGFTAVFVALAVLAGSLGGLLVEYQDLITRVLGVVVIVLGLGFLGLIPFLQNEKRVHLAPRAGLWGAPLLGVTFGLGWVPCIGPTLAAILTLSSTAAPRAAVRSWPSRSASGSACRSCSSRSSSTAAPARSAFLRRHRLAIMRFGGAMLVVLGIALVTGVWGDLVVVAAGCLVGGDPFVPVV